MRKLVALLAFLLCGLPAFGDQRYNVNSKVFTILRDQAWSNINDTYIFRPMEPRISLYIFIVNQNTTGTHTLSLSVFQTPDNQIGSRSGNTQFWAQDTVSGNCSTVGPASVSTCYVTTMFAAQVAIRITGAATVAGSPDLANIYIVQDVGEPKGQSVGGSSGVFESNFVNEGINQNAYSFGCNTSGAVASLTYCAVGSSATTTTKRIVFDRMVIASTMNVPMELGLTWRNNDGTGCTAGTATRTDGTAGGGVTAVNITEPPAQCTTEPTLIASAWIPITVPATAASLTIDLKGLNLPPFAGKLLAVSWIGGASGNFTVSYFWREQ